MPRVVHLIDADDPEEVRLALQPLLERLPTDRWSHAVVLTSCNARQFDFLAERPAGRLPSPFGLHVLSAAALKHYLTREPADLIHAWSIDAAYTAALARDDATPIALTRWDPHLTTRQSRRLLVLRERSRLGVLCHTAVVQRRLVEHGLPAERCAVVRPGVDFGVINRGQQAGVVRSALEVDPPRTVILLPAPPSRRGGHLAGLWVVEIASRVDPELLLLLPGVSDEQRKIERYLSFSPQTIDVRRTARRYGLEELICAADLLLLPASGDLSATPIAWAMAARVPIFAWAGYSVTEFIADGFNGHLVKADRQTLMAGKLLDVLEQRSQNGALYDRARAQAYEVFGISRYVEQVEQAYGNMLADRPVGEDIIDSAID